MQDTKLTTLLGGQTRMATLEDGSQEEIVIRQLPLRDYPKAFELLGDEIGLMAFICGKPRAQFEKIAPVCYEDVQAIAREVNEKGFFSYAARRQNEVAAQVKNLPPDLLNQALSRFTSPTPSPLSQRPPA